MHVNASHSEEPVSSQQQNDMPDTILFDALQRKCAGNLGTHTHRLRDAGRGQLEAPTVTPARKPSSTWLLPCMKRKTPL